MNVMSFSEISIYFKRTARRYSVDDINIHNHLCENSKYH
jgi:hypothetical protein